MILGMKSRLWPWRSHFGMRICNWPTLKRKRACLQWKEDKHYMGEGYVEARKSRNNIHRWATRLAQVMGIPSTSFSTSWTSRRMCYMYHTQSVMCKLVLIVLKRSSRVQFQTFWTTCGLLVWVRIFYWGMAKWRKAVIFYRSEYSTLWSVQEAVPVQVHVYSSTSVHHINVGSRLRAFSKETETCIRRDSELWTLPSDFYYLHTGIKHESSVQCSLSQFFPSTRTSEFIPENGSHGCW